MNSTVLKRLIISIGALVVCLLNFGAYKIPLSDRGVVVGVTVDKENGLYVVREQIVVSSGGNENNSASFYLPESTGQTLTDAFKQTEIKTGSVNFYKHCKIVVFGSGMTGEDVKYATETFYSEIDFPDSVPLVYYLGRAGDVLQATPPDGLASSFHLGKLLGTNLPAGVNAVSLKDYVIDVNKEGATAYMPVLNVTPFSAVQGEDTEQSYSIFDVKKTIFFNQTGSLILNEEQSLGFSYAKTKLRSGQLTIDSGDARISLRIKRCKGKAKFDKETKTVSVSVRLELQTTEIYSEGKSRIHLEKISEEEKQKICNLVSQRIAAAFETGKENGFDIFNNVKADEILNIKLKTEIKTVIK